jgi:hypothetical protein
MPAIDQCHQQVVHALQRDGWNVLPNPYTLSVEQETLLFIDIRAQRTSEERKEILLIEIKCFPEGRADTHELYVAFGQYLVYRSIARQKTLNAEVYLAVPTFAFDDVISRLGLPAVRDNQIRIVVIDIEHEVIRQWL